MIDGLLVQIRQQFFGDRGEAGLSVTHGRSTITIDGTEIALAIDQRITH